MYSSRSRSTHLQRALSSQCPACDVLRALSMSTSPSRCSRYPLNSTQQNNPHLVLLCRLLGVGVPRVVLVLVGYVYISIIVHKSPPVFARSFRRELDVLFARTVAKELMPYAMMTPAPPHQYSVASKLVPHLFPISFFMLVHDVDVPAV